MKLIEHPDGTKIFRINHDEFAAINYAFYESIVFLGDCEFNSRIGVAKDEAKSLKEHIRNTWVIRINEKELTAVCNALNFSLEHIEDWEFQTLVGVEKEEVRLMLGELAQGE